MGKEICLFVVVLVIGLSLCKASDYPAGLSITDRNTQAAAEKGSIQGSQVVRVTEFEQVIREQEETNQRKGSMCCDPCGLCSCVGVAVRLCQDEYWRIGLQMLQGLYARHLAPRR